MDGKLNLAHREDRRSQRFVKAGKINDAINCHLKAATLLTELLNSGEFFSAKVLESLELQRSYHLRFKDVIKVQHDLNTARRRALEMAEKEASDDHLIPKEEDRHLSTDSEELQFNILRKMAETDSLLAFLNPKQEFLDPVLMTRSDTSTVLNTAYMYKIPKDQKHVIEELETNNKELKKMVQQLCSELETVQQERNQLATTVKELEKKLSTLNQSQPHNDTFSPNGFSPLCEISPGGGIRELPVLAPLELPPFDFDSLKT